MNEHDEAVQTARHFGDVRDDYDDEFGRFLTPSQIARNKVRIPAIGLIVVGSLGLLAGPVIFLGVLIEELSSFYTETDVIALAGFLVLAGMGLFAVILHGGISMLTCRRRHWVMVAAFIVTSFTIFGPWGVLFYPFGIWALVVLFQGGVRKEFDRVKAAELAALVKASRPPEAPATPPPADTTPP